MRKGFTDENSKEMEVVLKIRVPYNFDSGMEARIDEALADTLYELGYELVDSKEYRDVVNETPAFEGKSLLDELRLFYDASVNGSVLYVDCWKGESVEIFLADDGGLMCLLPDEDEPRALRERIQDVEPGDAFLYGDGGSIRTSSEAAHQNFDEPDNPWILYGDDGDCYFEEDFGSDIGERMRELLEKVTTDLKPAQYPLQNYDDAVGHLCEALNRRDYELDLDDNWAPIKADEFVPIFKSENYFGVYCWHNDENQYYLVDRNNGEHKMVLGDSFEFVGQNTLGCLEGEKVLHVANREWLKYLIDFSLGNVKDIVPESELGGIAVLESAWRDECEKQGGYVMGTPLAERIKMATEKSAQGEQNEVAQANGKNERTL